jgi:hypothetical protein
VVGRLLNHWVSEGLFEGPEGSLEVVGEAFKKRWFVEDGQARFAKAAVPMAQGKPER